MLEEIIPLIKGVKLDELRSMRDPRRELAGLRDFLTNASLTGSGHLKITVASAIVPGIGEVEELEILFSGRFILSGDSHIVTDLGYLNFSKLLRDIERVLDDEGL